MRVISGLVAAMLLLVLSQPASAVCIIRGGAKTCVKDPKYWNVAADSEKEDPAQGTSVKSIVLQPTELSGNAWVVTPENGEGATLSSASAAAPACSLGVDC